MPFRDRFDGRRFVASGEQMTGFALVTVANELDLVRRGALDAEWREDVADLFDRLVPHAGPVAATAAAEPVNGELAGTAGLYRWRTDADLAGTCGRLDVTTSNGTTYPAFFTFE